MPPHSSSSDGPQPSPWDAITSDDDLDFLGPSDRAQFPVVKHVATGLPVVQPRRALGETPAEIAKDQQIEAVYRIHEKASGRFRFPLPSLDQLAGSLGRGELWTLGGRQGNGKSLFLQNFAGWLLQAGKRTLYMGTEQDASTLKVKQACVMVGVHARLMLKPTEEEQASVSYQTASKLVQDQLAWLTEEPQASTLIYSNERYIDRAIFQREVERAVGDWGVEVVIVDHLHHMQHGDGRSPVTELTQTVHLAKGTAVDEGITVVAASQITRTGGDPVKAYTPPAAEDFAGASAIERTSDVMLGIWRPLRWDLDHDALKAYREKVKLGQAPEDRIYEPNVMGVRCLKDRLGDAPGKQTVLAVTNQQLAELGRHAHATDYDSVRRV